MARMKEQATGGEVFKEFFDKLWKFEKLVNLSRRLTVALTRSHNYSEVADHTKFFFDSHVSL